MTSSACIRVLALATAMALTSGASAAPIVFPGNGNAYELIRIQTTWANARTLASTYAHGGPRATWRP